MDLTAFASIPLLISVIPTILMGLIGFFLLGLVLYYFTGTKPGSGVITNFMRVGTRFYLHLWMLIAIMVEAMGLTLLLKAILGGLFTTFVYSRGGNYASMDLQVGIVLVLFGLIVFGAHWFLARSVETEREKKGTFVTKIFVFIGLMVFSLLFFGTLLMFSYEFISYLVEQVGRPGGTLATMLGMMPAWVYYTVKAISLVREEK